MPDGYEFPVDRTAIMRDVNRAYQLGANSFLVKPADFAEFVAVIGAMQGYWLWIDKAPEVVRSPMDATDIFLPGTNWPSTDQFGPSDPTHGS